MNTTLQIAQIAVSVAMIVLVLLQESSSAGGGIFGAGVATDVGYQTRRGMGKFAHVATIVCAALFAALAIANLVLSK